ncbi:MAG: cytochrome b5-like heme/steroid binding domain-containing protein [Candidatus Pacearchaeota archaeon]|jgi:cytochrome b involved in lipid metabolism
MNITKKITGIAIIVAFIFLIVIFVSGIILYNPNSSNLKGYNLSTDNNSIGPAPGVSLVLDMVEISKHNNKNDCWLLINNKIYDVTSFISVHPGGSSTILNSCGKESTQEFTNRGGTGAHSSNAYGLLNLYYIGDFGQTIGTTELQNKTSTAQNSNVPINVNDDDEEEDD